MGIIRELLLIGANFKTKGGDLILEATQRLRIEEKEARHGKEESKINQVTVIPVV